MIDVFEKLFRDTRAELREASYDPKVMASKGVQAKEFDAETDRLWEEAVAEYDSHLQGHIEQELDGDPDFN